MLTAYIAAAMAQAAYKILEDGSYFGEVPGLQGVWADGATLEECRRVLQEVIEEWLLLKVGDGDDIPEIGGIKLAQKSAAA